MEDERLARVELEVWSALRRFDEAFEWLLARVVIDPRRPELAAEYLGARGSLAAHVEALREALHRALPGPFQTVPGHAVASLPGSGARSLPAPSDASPALAITTSLPVPVVALPPSEAEVAFAALLFHYDERELARTRALPEATRPPLLQTQYAEAYDGGERFFEYLERTLRAPAPPALMLELFLFCLIGGFCGRYANAEDPARKAYRDELARRVTKRRADPPADGRSSAPLERIEGAAFPWQPYLAGLLVLTLGWLWLNSSAEAHQRARPGLTECIAP